MPEAQTAEEPQVSFPQTPKPVQPCSENVCERGHRWAPTLALTKCQGCQAPVLAVLMTNCPVCNEPVARFKLRTDHLAGGGPVVKACKGEEGPAEVAIIEMDRCHAAEAEAMVAREAETAEATCSVNS